MKAHKNMLTQDFTNLIHEKILHINRKDMEVDFILLHPDAVRELKFNGEIQFSCHAKDPNPEQLYFNGDKVLRYFDIDVSDVVVSPKL